MDPCGAAADEALIKVAGDIGSRYGTTGGQLLAHLVMGDRRHPGAPPDECGAIDPTTTANGPVAGGPLVTPTTTTPRTGSSKTGPTTRTPSPDVAIRPPAEGTRRRPMLPLVPFGGLSQHQISDAGERDHDNAHDHDE
ncbi:hypothetical protein [Nonomuraea dietziae]|uniref:hypothetical protein n=1 Tax=Nonomuraea dietziae TaxID=65515 RepID=UPI003445C91F